MKVALFIPARYGSVRLKAKPMADICGKPMVERVYRQAEKAALVSSVFVATDDERIFNAVKSFGGNALMTSPSHNSGTDRIIEAAEKTDAGIIVNLQGDEPLIGPDMIDAAIAPMLNDAGLLMSTIKTRMFREDEFHNPNIVKVVTDTDGFALYFSRSPIPYPRSGFSSLKAAPFKHIGLYVYRREFLFKYSTLPASALEAAESLEQLRALENNIRIKVVEVSRDTISVDTAEDLERVRGVFKAGLN